MDDGDVVGLTEPFPRGGSTHPAPDWAYHRHAGLEVLSFRPNTNVEYTLYRFTITNEHNPDESIASDTVMSLDTMR